MKEKIKEKEKIEITFEELIELMRDNGSIKSFELRDLVVYCYNPDNPTTRYFENIRIK